MIRSRSIPPVLARAAGDGIHAILLTDADGELLGSYGNPPPPPPPFHQQGGTNDDTGDNGVGGNNSGGIPNPSSNLNNTTPLASQWPSLDAASIGALISEVAGDYRRMGEELWMLDPQYHQRQSSNISDDGPSGKGNGEQDRGQDERQNIMREGSSGGGSGGESEGEIMGNGGGEGDGQGNNKGSLSQQQQGNGKEKGNLDSVGSGANLKSLVIELDYVSVVLLDFGTSPMLATMIHLASLNNHICIFYCMFGYYSILSFL